jgi:hypothetical protein
MFLDKLTAAYRKEFADYVYKRGWEKNKRSQAPSPGTKTHNRVRTISPMPRPQNKPNSENPGCYDLIFLLSKADITRGDEVSISVIITGYGMLSGAKLLITPTPDLADKDGYKIEHSLGVLGDGKAHFGAISMVTDDSGATIDLSSGGLQQPGWAGPSLFFDSGVAIATENSTYEPPVRITLRINKKVAAGDHRLAIALTYFNGYEWRIAHRTAILHVPTLYERHEGYAWLIGAFIALVAMTAAIVAAVFAATGPIR